MAPQTLTSADSGNNDPRVGDVVVEREEEEQRDVGHHRGGTSPPLGRGPDHSSQQLLPSVPPARLAGNAADQDSTLCLPRRSLAQPPVQALI